MRHFIQLNNDGMTKAAVTVLRGRGEPEGPGVMEVAGKADQATAQGRIVTDKAIYAPVMEDDGQGGQRIKRDGDGKPVLPEKPEATLAAEGAKIKAQAVDKQSFTPAKLDSIPDAVAAARDAKQAEKQRQADEQAALKAAAEAERAELLEGKGNAAGK